MIKRLFRRKKAAEEADISLPPRVTPASPVLYVTDTLLTETGNLIESFACERESEGIVYWFGFEFGSKSIVTTLIVPDADTSRGDIVTSPEANAEALGVIVGTPLVLLGQVHSHPGRGVRHSSTDDRETFARFEHAISIVVPYFARHGIDLRRCGVHRHTNGVFELVSHKELERHVIVIPGHADLRRAHDVEQRVAEEVYDTI